ncbi:MAG: low molecular weight protein-tyrosine-phosphatase [Steroidobacteraceae bacterium]
MNKRESITSILFVCLGNICRSPAAENVMRKLLQDAGLDKHVRCDSAGTSNEHEGDPPDRRMCAAGSRRGLPMTGSARQVTRADLDAFDLILAMDDSNHAGLLRLANNSNRHKIRRFCDYLRHHVAKEVPDPWYGGASGFEHVLDLLEDGCAQLVVEIQANR